MLHFGQGLFTWSVFFYSSPYPSDTEWMMKHLATFDFFTHQ